jgi:alpha-ribazole phosphatase
MKIILVRHGQTEWNALKKYQGQIDIPINNVGRDQAARAGKYLADREKVEAIYCSDLSRTRETADIIAGSLNLKPIPDKRLRELSFGLWEGLTFTEVYEKYPQEFDNWYNDTFKIKVPEGESFNDLIERALSVIKEIINKHTGTVVVVTHGGVVKGILSQTVQENDLWKTTVEPGSITYIEATEEKLKCIEVGIVP